MMDHRALVLALVLPAACGGSTSSQPTPPPSNTVAAKEESPPSPSPAATRVQAIFAAFETFTNRMCQCKDTTCAQEISAELTAWAQEIAKDPAANDSKPSEAEAKRMGELATKLGDCMTNAMGASGAGAGSSVTP
jgi:hypothetical protein